MDTHTPSHRARWWWWWGLCSAWASHWYLRPRVLCKGFMSVACLTGTFTLASSSLPGRSCGPVVPPTLPLWWGPYLRLSDATGRALHSRSPSAPRRQGGPPLLLRDDHPPAVAHGRAHALHYPFAHAPLSHGTCGRGRAPGVCAARKGQGSGGGESRHSPRTFATPIGAVACAHGTSSPCCAEALVS